LSQKLAGWFGAQNQVISAKKTQNYPNYDVTHKKQIQNLQFF